MVREYHVAVLLANHVSTFCIGLCVSGGSYTKYTYMIGREYSHVVLKSFLDNGGTLVPFMWKGDTTWV